MSNGKNAAQYQEDLLSALIRQAAPKSDARAISRDLLMRHGSLASALETLPEDIQQSTTLGKSAAQLINLVPQLARYLRCEEPPGLIRCAADAGRFLAARYIGIHYEQVYLLCLNQNGRVLSLERLQEGTLDETPFYVRHIAEGALRSAADAVIISHNHPSGAREPSRPDVAATLRTIEALRDTGVVLLDHIILADQETISLRLDGPLPAALFLSQNETLPLLRNWTRN